MTFAIPNSLGISLKKYQNQENQFIKVNADRIEYVSGEIINIRLPTEGWLDIRSLSLSGIWKTVMYTATQFPTLNANATLVVNSPTYVAEVIQYLKVVIGNQEVGLTNLTDYGFLYRLLKTHKYAYNANSTTMDLLKQGEFVSQTMTTSSPTKNDVFCIPELLGLFSPEQDSSVYLPLDLLPNIVITIKLHPLTRWYNSLVQTNNTTNTGTVNLLKTIALYDVALTYNRVVYKDDSILNAYKQMLLTGNPISFPFKNYTMIQTYPYINRLFYQLQANVISLDKIYLANREEGFMYTSGENKVNSLYCGANYQITIAVNNSPLTNVPMDSLTVSQLWKPCFRDKRTLEFRCFDPNYLVDPISFSDFQSKFWIAGIPLELGIEDESGDWITGKSSLGTYMNISVSVKSDETVKLKYGVIILEHTSVLQIGFGRTVFVLN